MVKSTVPDAPPLRHIRRARDLRRILLAGIILLVAAGVSGLAGERQGSVSDSAGGYRLSVEHPARTRAGLPVGIRVVVERDRGFDGPVTLGVSTEYLELFAEEALAPQPSSSTSDGRWLYLQFDPPPGDTLAVRYVSRVDTGAHRGRRGVVAVFEGGEEVVTVGVDTVVVP